MTTLAAGGNMQCCVEGCERRGSPKHAGKCFGHAKRKTRKRPLAGMVREYGTPGAKRLEAAALRLAGAESDEDYRRALASLLKSVQRFRRKKDNVQKPTDTASRG